MNLDGLNEIDWNIGVIYGGSGSGTIAAGNSLTGQFVSEITIFD